MITSFDCLDQQLGCDSGLFSTHSSKTAVVDSMPLFTNINVGQIFEFAGYNASDTLSDQQGNVIDSGSFSFFVIDSVGDSNGIPDVTWPYDGVLGLGPNTMSNNDMSVGDPLVLNLK